MSGRGTGSAPSLQIGITDTAVLVQTGRISLTGFFQYNSGNAAAYIRFFDAAAAADVTLGTTACDYAVGAAATSFSQGSFDRPIQFTKGLVIAACTDVVTANHAPPNATQIVALALGD
jgi:hypothetical protein